MVREWLGNPNQRTKLDNIVGNPGKFIVLNSVCTTKKTCIGLNYEGRLDLRKPDMLPNLKPALILELDTTCRSLIAWISGTDGVHVKSNVIRTIVVRRRHRVRYYVICDVFDI